MSPYNLKPLANYTAFDGPLLFIIMDGVGLGPQDESDGVHLAYTPTLDKLMAEEPLYTKLKAHGLAVGQPSDGDMGNSEVGHNALGAGRIFPQGAKLCNEAIASKRVFESDAWKSVVGKGNDGGTVHFMGLLSDGNVHSNIQQLLDMLDQCATEGVARVRCHILTDGRDVGEKSAPGYIERLEAKLSECSVDGQDYRIGSGGGRMYITMDRYDADWAMVERGWKAHVLGEGRQFASAAEAVQTYYDEDETVTDQHLGEFVIAEDGKPVGTIEDGDSVVYLNFRGDRALEMTRCFEEGDEFDVFDRVRTPDVFYAGIMQYDGDLKKWLSKDFNGMPMEKIKKEDIHSFIFGTIAKAGATAHSQKRILKTLRRIFESALDEGVIARNPAKGIRIKVPPPKKLYRLSSLSLLACLALL
ncbi:MAG: hypothetical protein L3K26_20585 [Candidatus Hydrogenedentes bacterium]|nr:hypothetical protein [Candidatus Hydrogenedentota bacterium]